MKRIKLNFHNIHNIIVIHFSMLGFELNSTENIYLKVYILAG